MNRRSPRDVSRDVGAGLYGVGGPTLAGEGIGPALAHLESNAPTWPSDELPRRRHHRSGRDCNASSRSARTKKVSLPTTGSVTYELEACHCGGRRQVIDGVPDTSWSDINCGVDDSTWCTRAAGHPSFAEPVDSDHLLQGKEY